MKKLLYNCWNGPSLRKSEKKKFLLKNMFSIAWNEIIDCAMRLKELLNKNVFQNIEDQKFVFDFLLKVPNEKY